MTSSIWWGVVPNPWPSFRSGSSSKPDLILLMQASVPTRPVQLGHVI